MDRPPASALRLAVRSFDLFDTLLARHCIDPAGIFRELERRFGLHGFAQTRQQTEWALAAEAASRPFTLYDIYGKLVESGMVPADVAQRLLAAEIQLEIDNAIPIRENIRQVRPGDLILTDMYLPHEVLRRLLDRIGVPAGAHLLASNLGKAHGTLWPQLREHWIITRHLGDNPVSDGESPAAAGIPAELCRQHQPTAVEQALLSSGRRALAQICRRLRLENPHAGTAEHDYWLLFSQYNLPLLVFLVEQCRQVRNAYGLRKLLFSARDCFLLAELFGILYPAETGDYLHVSREALHTADADYLAYLDRQDIRRALVVDLNGTGGSWWSFSRKHDFCIHLHYLVLTDNAPHARRRLDDLLGCPTLKLSWHTLASERQVGVQHIELMNPAQSGTCIGIRRSGDLFTPLTLARSELPDTLTSTLLAAHRRACECIERDRETLAVEAQAPVPASLPGHLIDAIAASPALQPLGALLQWPPSFGQTMN